MTTNEMSIDADRAEDGPQRTLPSRCYTDAAIYARELETIFRHCWQPIGNAIDVKEPGNYLSGRIVGQDIVVVRGHDHVLRGFFNVCRHRGHRLLQGKGTLKTTIICPYHAWGYGLDGRLQGAPNANNVAGFDKNRVFLSPVGVAEVGGLVLVNLDRQAPSFDEEFAGVERELQAFVPRLADLEHSATTVATMECNWKIMVENYAECYHCAHAHPTLTTTLLDADAYQVELFARHHRHSTGPVTGGITLYEVNENSGAHAEEYRAWLLWPNYSLQVNPGSNFVLLHFIPDGPERTIAKIDWYFGPWVTEHDRERIVENHRLTTLEEDQRLVAEVQIGLNNSSYDRGVLMVDATQPCSGSSEHTVAHLQNLWREVMGAESGAQ